MMSTYSQPAEKSAELLGIGVLLTNTGSPEAPTASAVRKYLAEFLADRRVIDWPRPVWLPILHGVILNLRPARSARLYQRIWTEEGSPLLVGTRKLAAALQVALQERTVAPVWVELGMNYGQPSIAEGLENLLNNGARRVLVWPLFPQYSSTTTAAAFDAVYRYFERRPWIPDLRLVNGYAHHPAYLQALAAHIRAAWQGTSEPPAGPPGKLLFSFHGIPERYARQGDPYPEECRATAARLAELLGLSRENWQLAYQSRFGPEAWLQPATSDVLVEWGRRGLERVQVVCPGFAVDCLETLDEIAYLGQEDFTRAGGGEFRYLPAMNDHPRHVRALAEMIWSQISGWRSA